MTATKTKRKNTLQSVFRRSAREWLAMKTKNMAKTYTRRDRVLLKSDYYDNQRWGWKMCWKGYKIAKSEGVYYAKGIQRLQKDLGIEISDFYHLGLVTPSSSDDEDNNCICDRETTMMGGNNNTFSQIGYDSIYNDETATNGVSKYGSKYNEKISTNGEDEFDNYEEYVSNLPMGIEPISEYEFYKKHSSIVVRTIDKIFEA